MSKCSVEGCSNQRVCRRRTETIFSYPLTGVKRKNPKRFVEFLKIIGYKGSPECFANKFICSAHFSDDAFQPCVNPLRAPKLRDDAWPTLNLVKNRAVLRPQVIQCSVVLDRNEVHRYMSRMENFSTPVDAALACSNLSVVKQEPQDDCLSDDLRYMLHTELEIKEEDIPSQFCITGEDMDIIPSHHLKLEHMEDVQFQQLDNVEEMEHIPSKSSKVEEMENTILSHHLKLEHTEDVTSRQLGNMECVEEMDGIPSHYIKLEHTETVPSKQCDNMDDRNLMGKYNIKLEPMDDIPSQQIDVVENGIQQFKDLIEFSPQQPNYIGILSMFKSQFDSTILTQSQMDPVPSHVHDSSKLVYILKDVKELDSVEYTGQKNCTSEIKCNESETMQASDKVILKIAASSGIQKSQHTVAETAEVPSFLKAILDGHVNCMTNTTACRLIKMNSVIQPSICRVVQMNGMTNTSTDTENTTGLVNVNGVIQPSICRVVQMNGMTNTSTDTENTAGLVNVNGVIQPSICRVVQMNGMTNTSSDTENTTGLVNVNGVIQPSICRVVQMSGMTKPTAGLESRVNGMTNPSVGKEIRVNGLTNPSACRIIKAKPSAVREFGDNVKANTKTSKLIKMGHVMKPRIGKSSVHKKVKLIGKPSTDIKIGMTKPSADTKIGMTKPSADTEIGVTKPSADTEIGVTKPSADTEIGVTKPSADTEIGMTKPSADTEIGVTKPSADTEIGVTKPSADTKIGMSKPTNDTEIGMTKSRTDTKIGITEPTTDTEISMQRFEATTADVFMCCPITMNKKVLKVAIMDEFNKYLDELVDTSFKQCSNCSQKCISINEYYAHAKNCKSGEIDFTGYVDVAKSSSDFSCRHSGCTEKFVNNCSKLIHEKYSSHGEYSSKRNKKDRKLCLLLNATQLRCPICHVTFKDEKLFHAHCNSPTLFPELLHFCTKCKYYFECVETYTLHMKRVHGHWDCPLCCRKFVRDFDMIRHKQWGHNIWMVHCSGCFKTVSFDDFVGGHHRACYNKKPLHCSICGRMFQDFTELNTHLETKLANMEHQLQYQCRNCFNYFCSKFNLFCHMVHTACRPSLNGKINFGAIGHILHISRRAYEAHDNQEEF